jgi:two-component SAPR family response regulator
MVPAGETRIRFCGRFVVRLDGRRVEGALAGAKGHLLFAYLVLNRFRRIGRDELLDAIYGEEGAHRRQDAPLPAQGRRGARPSR